VFYVTEFACLERDAVDIASAYVIPAHEGGNWHAAPNEDGVFLTQLEGPLAGVYAETRDGRLDGTRFKDDAGSPLARFEGDEADLTWGWADAW
jgi:hypothetical protein